jgi:hypothetical protein
MHPSRLIRSQKKNTPNQSTLTRLNLILFRKKLNKIEEALAGLL